MPPSFHIQSITKFCHFYLKYILSSVHISLASPPLNYRSWPLANLFSKIFLNLLQLLQSILNTITKVIGFQNQFYNMLISASSLLPRSIKELQLLSIVLRIQQSLTMACKIQPSPYLPPSSILYLPLPPFLHSTHQSFPSFFSLPWTFQPQGLDTCLSFTLSP